MYNISTTRTLILTQIRLLNKYRKNLFERTYFIPNPLITLIHSI